MKSAFLLLSAAVFTLAAQGLWLGMLKNFGLVAPNYKQKEIPFSQGPLFLGSAVFAFWTAELFGFFSRTYYPFLFLLSGMALLGFIDDTLGGREAKGFRGHFRSLLHGKLTTGGLKATAGALLALVVASTMETQPAQILLAAVLIALTANTLNLLDLRPGRALKAWLGLVLLLFLVGGQLRWLLPLLGASLIWAPLDLRAQAMLGDSGANCLGAALGYSLAQSLGWRWQLGTVILFLLLNLLSERYSFSRLIERNPLLRFLDRLGRAQ